MMISIDLYFPVFLTMARLLFYRVDFDMFLLDIHKYLVAYSIVWKMVCDLSIWPFDRRILLCLNVASYKNFKDLKTSRNCKGWL